MLIDLTLPITAKIMKDAEGNEKKALVGHIGTHFDVMDKTFPLEYSKRECYVFNVFEKEEITINDIDTSQIKEGMFIAFYTGFIERVEYGSKEYFSNHPILSYELINLLIKKKVSLIGIDFAGVRRSKEHTPTDQLFADNNIFVIENMCNLSKLIDTEKVTINTFPMNYVGLTGLPCRIIAELV